MIMTGLQEWNMKTKTRITVKNIKKMNIIQREQNIKIKIKIKICRLKKRSMNIN